MGIESLKREDICIADSLCCTAETKTTLYINYTPIKINFKNKIKLQIQHSTYNINHYLIFCVNVENFNSL